MTPERVLRFEEFNEDQKALIEAIRAGNNVLITGPAGTGKTAIMRYVQTQFPNVAITASTGIAALGVGGCTIHRWAGLGKGDLPAAVIAKKIVEAKGATFFSMKMTEKLVIDEISMLSDKLLQLISDVLQIVRRNQEPFGGIQLIAVGDFLQLPPVDKRLDDEAADEKIPSVKFAFEAPVWQACQPRVRVLSQVMRQKDVQFADILRRIRLGDTSEEVRAFLRPRINALDIKPEIAPLVITTHNNTADSINQEKLDRLPGKDVFFQSQDWGVTDYMRGQIDKACIAPMHLRLRVGAQVMLLWNVDPDAGLVNGSLGTVVEFKRSIGGVEIPVCDFNGVRYECEHEEWSLKRGDKTEATRRQIPLRLGWAITGHKSQGLTLDKVRVHLKRCFQPGQGYVMLSRARTLEGLFIADITGTSIWAHPTALEFYQKNAQWTAN